LKDINSIVSELEQQRDAIERAIKALKEVTGARAVKPTIEQTPLPAGRKKRHLSAEGRRRIIEATKKRWAAKRAAAENAPASKKPVPAVHQSSKRLPGKKSAARKRVGASSS
jgi:hypothetical protein